MTPNPALKATSVVTLEPEFEVRGEPPVLFGVMAEFKDHEQLLEAAKRAYAAGFREMDAYSPFPIEGLPEAIGFEYTAIPLITLCGGMVGGLGAYFMEWYSMGPLYPLNVGGRPLNSWPNFIPVVFELTVLIASLSAFISVLVLNKLPHLHHPVFNSEAFRRASIDRFFLCIEATDPQFDLRRARAFLETLHPLQVEEVHE
jgi:Protein of unknown function (DUF3341)